MYSAFNDFLGLFIGPDCMDITQLIVCIIAVFLCLLGNANSVIFNKILNFVVAAFGIWWSIGIINVPNWEYSDTHQIVIYIFTAIIFSLALCVFLGPLMWSDEKAETSYYLIADTFIYGTTEYSGGIKGLGISTAIILTIGGFAGTAAARAMGFATAGIVGLIIYIGLLALNCILSVRFVKNEWL